MLRERALKVVVVILGLFLFNDLFNAFSWLLRWPRKKNPKPRSQSRNSTARFTWPGFLF